MVAKKNEQAVFRFLLCVCAALMASTVLAFAEDGPLRVALDPGHGGTDPGAEASGLDEATIVLDFAKRLKAALDETGAFVTVLTRETDDRVDLDRRLTIARQAGAGVFISLHADALEEGDGSASGVTVYTLADDEVWRADRRLMERHGGDDLLGGVDLTGAGDDIAQTLFDLARRDTMPRSQALAGHIIRSFDAGDLAVNSRPHRHGGFAVLKAADVPSILLELGFLSSARDRERMTSEAWLTRAAEAVRDGLLLWHDEDRLRSKPGERRN